MMLNKSKNNSNSKVWSAVSLLLAATVLCGAIVLQSTDSLAQKANTYMKDLTKMPMAPNGTEWNLYLNKHMKYPKAAMDKHLEGRVMVKYTVAADGSVVNARIVNSTDTVFSAAALEIIAGMPKWQPGEKNGKKVAVDMYQPFLYNLGGLEDKGMTLNGRTRITMSDPNVNYDTAQKYAVEQPLSLQDDLSVANGKLTKEHMKVYEDAIKQLNKAQAELEKAQAQLEKSQREIELQNKQAEAAFEQTGNK